MKQGEKIFMTDIETTHTLPHLSNILEFGTLELTFDGHFWIPGKEFGFIEHTSLRPATAFAREHMTALYDRCNKAPQVSRQARRKQILDFFQSCGKQGAKDVKLCGYNAGYFDAQMLNYHKYLVPPHHVPDPENEDKEVMRGDHHYRITDLNGYVDCFKSVFNLDMSGDDVLGLVSPYDGADVKIPDWLKPHDAIYDCYRQAKMMNGIIGYYRKEINA